MEVLGTLSKRLRDIEDLPLKVVSVQPISPGNNLLYSFMFMFMPHSVCPQWFSAVLNYTLFVY